MVTLVKVEIDNSGNDNDIRIQLKPSDGEKS